MARYWSKSKGKMPQNITIQFRQVVGAEVIFSQYFSNPSEYNGTFKNINFKLCETTRNYIRQTTVQDFEK